MQALGTLRGSALGPRWGVSDGRRTVAPVTGGLFRAARWGLAAGLLLASIALGVLALQNQRVDCAGLPRQQCDFERATLGEVARMQALGALGLACLGGGLALWARSARRRGQ